MDEYIREGARKNSALIRKMQGQPEAHATAEAKGGSHQQEVRAHQHHILKCWPEYFEAIGQGRKTFEVRENDRNYQEGDSLELREFEPCKRCDGSGRMWDCGDKMECVQCGPSHGEYTMRWLFCKVSYVMKGGSFGVSPRHVVMGIKLPANHQWPIAVCPNGEVSDPRRA